MQMDRNTKEISHSSLKMCSDWILQALPSYRANVGAGKLRTALEMMHKKSSAVQSDLSASRQNCNQRSGRHHLRVSHSTSGESGYCRAQCWMIRVMAAVSMPLQRPAAYVQPLVLMKRFRQFQVVKTAFGLCNRNLCIRAAVCMQAVHMPAAPRIRMRTASRKSARKI